MKRLRLGRLPWLAGYQLRRAQARFFADFRRRMADVPMTPAQYGLLTLIGENPGLSQSALARALGLKRSTMVAAINTFERRGLVERRRGGGGDQRAHALVLTAAGKRLMRELEPRIGEHEAHMLAALSEDEKKQLLYLLEKIWARRG